jgi:hypothetical protein
MTAGFLVLVEFVDVSLSTYCIPTLENILNFIVSVNITLLTTCASTFGIDISFHFNRLTLVSKV